jgi:hypothetical protein
MESNQGIVRFYLDQNIIDYLIKGKLEILDKTIKKIPQSEIVYSSITLREFSRIEDSVNRKPFLDFLKDNNAKYLWIDNNELAHFEDIDPFEQYNKVIQLENPIFRNIESSMQGMMHKLLGGEKDTSFNEIADSQKQSFGDLIEFINNNLNSLDNNNTVEMVKLKENTQKLISYFNGLIDKTTNQLKDNKNITDNPFNELRKLLEVKVVELNNIKPPNIISQIWDRIKDIITEKNINLSFDDLFGDGLFKYYSKQKITMTMKVNGLYNLLNSLGYHSDKNLHKDKKFYPFINDNQHIGYAIYSDFFVTRDKKVRKKAEVVYEHLKIGTQILFMK